MTQDERWMTRYNEVKCRRIERLMPKDDWRWWKTRWKGLEDNGPTENHRGNDFKK